MNATGLSAKGQPNPILPQSQKEQWCKNGCYYILWAWDSDQNLLGIKGHLFPYSICSVTLCISTGGPNGSLQTCACYLVGAELMRPL